MFAARRIEETATSRRNQRNVQALPYARTEKKHEPSGFFGSIISYFKSTFGRSSKPLKDERMEDTEDELRAVDGQLAAATTDTSDQESAVPYQPPPVAVRLRDRALEMEKNAQLFGPTSTTRAAAPPAPAVVSNGTHIATHSTPARQSTSTSRRFTPTRAQRTSSPFLTPRVRRSSASPAPMLAHPSDSHLANQHVLEFLGSKGSEALTDAEINLVADALKSGNKSAELQAPEVPSAAVLQFGQQPAFGSTSFLSPSTLHGGSVSFTLAPEVTSPSKTPRRRSTPIGTGIGTNSPNRRRTSISLIGTGSPSRLRTQGRNVKVEEKEDTKKKRRIGDLGAPAREPTTQEEQKTASTSTHARDIAPAGKLPIAQTPARALSSAQLQRVRTNSVPARSSPLRASILPDDSPSPPRHVFNERRTASLSAFEESPTKSKASSVILDVIRENPTQESHASPPKATVKDVVNPFEVGTPVKLTPKPRKSIKPQPRESAPISPMKRPKLTASPTKRPSTSGNALDYIDSSAPKKQRGEPTQTNGRQVTRPPSPPHPSTKVPSRGAKAKTKVRAAVEAYQNGSQPSTSKPAEDKDAIMEDAVAPPKVPSRGDGTSVNGGTHFPASAAPAALNAHGTPSSHSAPVPPTPTMRAATLPSTGFSAFGSNNSNSSKSGSQGSNLFGGKPTASSSGGSGNSGFTSSFNVQVQVQAPPAPSMLAKDVFHANKSLSVSFPVVPSPLRNVTLPTDSSSSGASTPTPAGSPRSQAISLPVASLPAFDLGSGLGLGLGLWSGEGKGDGEHRDVKGKAREVDVQALPKFDLKSVPKTSDIASSSTSAPGSVFGTVPTPPAAIAAPPQAPSLSSPAAPGGAPTATSTPVVGFNYGAAGIALPRAAPEQWTCGLCSLKNPVSKDECEVCATPRPGGKGNAPKATGQSEASTSATTTATTMAEQPEAVAADTTATATAAPTAEAPPPAPTPAPTMAFDWGRAGIQRPVLGSWNCSDCGVNCGPAALRCPSCDAPKPQ
ncbi:hypothetical protein BOTBODRAFT_41911 [Botryobasidium botryosum FD-172 SS1]|uniref:RanBP2-type domain-containing protein n=1 Tax=Botryobasidium botryosum (strain FD-172 SS1) TaxID=930990 RepID=A0A067MW58_BOTB1|nr:hypothetical protein BOTBODRAFT_41911 [Botryobasidium botryosum FD-172 SS1]